MRAPEVSPVGRFDGAAAEAGGTSAPQTLQGLFWADESSPAASGDILVLGLALPGLHFKRPGLFHGQDDGRSGPGGQVGAVTRLHARLGNVFDQVAFLTKTPGRQFGVIIEQAALQLGSVCRQMDLGRL
jgi:hypothetical protein